MSEDGGSDCTAAFVVVALGLIFYGVMVLCSLFGL